MGIVCVARRARVCAARNGYARGITTLSITPLPIESRPMSQLARNLTAQREKAGLTVTQVHVALNRLGYAVAFSTVAGWFNGSRGVRSMEHLKALCAILQTDLDTLTGDTIEISEGPISATIAREAKGLPMAQQEMVLALIRSMKG